METKKIPVEKVIVLDNPRKSQVELEQLAQSILEQGLINPITVRLANKDKFELVAGTRRFAAIQLLGMKEIDATIREIKDEDIKYIQIIENYQRKDVHPMNEAESFAEMLKDGKTFEEIANIIGCSPSYVFARIKLNSLSNDLQNLFLEDKITHELAIYLSVKSKKDQKTAKEFIQMTLDRYKGNHVVSFDEISSRMINDIDLEFTIFGKNEVIDNLPTCDECPQNTKNNYSIFDDESDDEQDHTCLNSLCYTKKWMKIYNALVKQIKEKHPDKKIVFIKTYRSRFVPNLGPEEIMNIFSDDTNSLKAKDLDCPSTIIGINSNESDLSFKRICTNKKCKIHGDASAKEEEQKDYNEIEELAMKLKGRRQRERNIAAREAKRNMIHAILKEPVTLMADELKLIVDRLWDLMPSGQELACVAFGLMQDIDPNDFKYKRIPWEDNSEMHKKLIDAVKTPEDCSRVIRAFIIGNDNSLDLKQEEIIKEDYDDTMVISKVLAVSPEPYFDDAMVQFHEKINFDLEEFNKRKDAYEQKITTAKEIILTSIYGSDEEKNNLAEKFKAPFASALNAVIKKNFKYDAIFTKELILKLARKLNLKVSKETDQDILIVMIRDQVKLLNKPE